MVATWADFLLALGRLGDLLDLLDHRVDRLLDPALQRHRGASGGDVLHPSGRWTGPDGRRRRPVPATSGGLGRDFLHHLGAMFSKGPQSSTSLGHGDAVLGDVGRSNFLSSHDVPPFGPRVAFTALASLSTPFRMGPRPPHRTSVAWLACCLLLHACCNFVHCWTSRIRRHEALRRVPQHILFPHDQQLLVAQL